MSGPRILTFNFHEPYLCLMSKTGYRLEVGLYKHGMLARAWQTHFRPLPPNVTLVTEDRWRDDLENGRYDVVIAHNESNAVDIFEAVARSATPALLVCHNRRTFLETTVDFEKNWQGDRRKAMAAYARLLEKLPLAFQFVFISESKRADYGIPGTVIPPGLDVEEYGGYRGGAREILRVGNAMRDRTLMFDVDFQEQVCEGLPNRVVGVNPDIPGSAPAESYDHLLDLYRSRRCLLHVTREAYEDGYNLAMLEAMACGVPVVALTNATCPITDGVDGFTGADAETLRARLTALLDDVDRARKVGERGRQTVARQFPLERFAARWRETIEAAAGRKRSGTRTKPAPSREPSARLNVLMDFMNSPITTARYFERAFRKRHDVLTVGSRCPEAFLERWGFAPSAPEYSPQQVEMPLNRRGVLLLDRLPPDFKPDLYLWIDSGVSDLAPDLNQIDAIKVCYMVDSHCAHDIRTELAKQFDVTFVAQQPHEESYRRAGVNAFWLPLACSPELHNLPERERTIDVAYVGSLGGGDSVSRRQTLLGAIRERFPNHRIVQCWPEEMAEVYARAKVVFNACVARDVNMRVFEALAAGALLVTDEADGLEDLFTPGEHLAVYHDDAEALDLIAYYLEHDDERQKIALAGRRHVLRHHTYDHRVIQMTDFLEQSRQPQGGGISGESRYEAGGYYRSDRPELAAHVPEDAQRVLDIGCGGGEFGRALKERGVREVVGVELVERAWQMARQNLDDAILGNIESIDLPFIDGHFDCVCFGDVLEHLVDPTAVLTKCARVLRDDGLMVMSIPNVRFFQVIVMLASGRWRYDDAGILDRTHLRFFTAYEMQEMVRQAGLEVARMAPLSMWPPNELPRTPDNSLALGKLTLHDVGDMDYQDLLTFQYLVVARKANADPLASARKALESGEPAKAYGIAEQASQADPAERALIMAKAAAQIGKLDRAEALYREALSLRPDDMQTRTNLGLILLAMNRGAEASPVLEEVVAADPENARALGGLGLVDVAAGRLGEGFDRFKQTLDAHFDNGPILTHMVQLAYQLERLPEVEAPLRRYVDFHPGDMDMTYALAALLHRLGLTPEALEHLNTILLIAPDHEAAAKLHAQLSGESDAVGG